MKRIDKIEIINNIGKVNKEQVNEEYANLYSLYHILVTKYLSKILNLKSIDELFLNSSLGYKCIDEKNMDIYQYLSSPELKYFYLRNNIHIDRLDEIEKEFLKYKLYSNNENLDNKTKQYLEITMPKILAEKYNVENIDINYGPISKYYFAPANALIIGFRYDEYYDKEIIDEKWDKNHDKQCYDKTDLIAEAYNLLKKANINMPFEIIEYNDFSVIERNINSKKLT